MKKLKLKWHPEASVDLSVIIRYCRQRFGSGTARKVRDSLFYCAELLRTSPLLGPIEQKLQGCTRLEYRGLVADAHTQIIYTVHKEYVYIHLLWDVRKDDAYLPQAAVQRYHFSEEEQHWMVNEESQEEYEK
ncbi:MAG: type II toxin-antitoxin system RelE/ParE family toxin [Bacteroides sp.]|nr:type II toxin-antitoxin system RelE/ParE family toxin [Bacteroides sp.]